MQLNFDLDEFIAYILNGGLVLIAVQWIFGSAPSWMLNYGLNNAPVFQTVLNIALFGGLAILSGHVCSIFSRHISRVLLWRVFGSPRVAPFRNLDCKVAGTPEPSGFWHIGLCTKVNDHFKRLIDLPSDVNKSVIAPRLIRTHVLENSSRLVRVRDRIVRARSICANATLPLLLAVVASGLQQNWILSTVFALVGVLLLWKQHDLDQREWKEIYTAFIVLDIGKAPERVEPTQSHQQS